MRNPRQRTSTLVGCLSVSLLAITCSATAYAQTSTPAAQAPQPAEPDLGEIVVTATRKSESINRVPLSISALSQTALDQQGVRGVGSLSQVTPGLSFTPGLAGEQTSIAIRGITSGVGASTVGVYLDDAPLQARALGFLFRNPYPRVFDLDRVEVLKGPQGTLFGAGSEGGTVRFIAPKPSLDTFTGYARGEVNSVKGGGMGYEGGVALGGPIVRDAIGFRVSGWYNREAGWVDRVNSVTGQSVDKNSNVNHSYVLRGAVTAQVTPDLKITPSVFFQKERSSDTATLWGFLSDPSDGVFRNGNPLAQDDHDRILLPALAVEYAGEGFQVFSSTSYLSRKNTSNPDYSTYASELLTGGAVSLPDIPGYAAQDQLNAHQKTFTQELRIQSDNDSRLSWVAGVYYSRSKQSAIEKIHDPQFAALSNLLLGCTPVECFGLDALPGDFSFVGEDHAVDKQIALFGEAKFAITPEFSVLAGGRYARTKFSFTTLHDGPISGGLNTASGSSKERPFTPRFGVTYTPNSTTLYYATASKGFRVGGANAPVPAARCAGDLSAIGQTTTPIDYSSDTVWNYEVGVKKGLFDRRLQVNGSLYYLRWNQIQQNVYLPTCGFQYTANLGKATSKGFELSVLAKPVDQLTLSADLSYIRARYTEDVLGGVLVADGDKLPFPAWGLTLSSEYVAELSQAVNGYARLQMNYRSSYDRLPAVPAATADPGVAGVPNNTNVMLRAGVRFDGFDISLFADNLLNSSATTFRRRYVTGSSLIFTNTLRPRTLGVTATSRF